MNAIMLLATLAAASNLRAQESPGPEPVTPCCDHGRAAKPWIGAQGGVKWEKSLDHAKRRAAEEGKPVLLFQLVGDLDREGC
jgi:hypothetical protein